MRVTRRNGFGAALAFVLAGMMSVGPALAGEWDGVWGQPKGVMIKVNGSQVEYTNQGNPFQTSGVSMDATQLSFYMGTAGHARLTMNKDKTAILEESVNGRQRTSKIWRGKQYN